MPTANLDTLLQFFKALSNESRLKLLGILSQQERNVEELAALLDLKEPTISHHLAKLKELNLVQMRTQGNTHLYKLNSETLQTLSKEILTPDQIASLTQAIEGDAWESKVLSNFWRAIGSKKFLPVVKNGSSSLNGY